MAIKVLLSPSIPLANYIKNKSPKINVKDDFKDVPAS
jgi:hypothetical protein